MEGGLRVGIDFGTSHTVAMCLWRGTAYPLLFDASPLLPSAVFAAPDGLLVGRDAERSARTDPAAYEPYPKQRIDDGTVLLGNAEHAVADLIAAVLRRCLDEAARVAGERPEQVVLTHPAGWGAQRKAVLGEAAARCDIARLTMVSEPTAAAVYFSRVMGLQVADDAAVVVYDFGAGTFDVAVVTRQAGRWEVVASDGLDDVGGIDLDGVVVERLRAAAPQANTDGWSRLAHPQNSADRRHRRFLWDDARAAKEQLSRSAVANVHVPIYETDLHVTREEFERHARPWLERTVARTAETMAQSGIRRQRLAGLFLVGGSSRIPLIATLLHQRLGIAPTVIEQPELVVAQGSLYTVPEFGSVGPVPVPVPVQAARGGAARAVGSAAVPPPPPPPPSPVVSDAHVAPPAASAEPSDPVAPAELSDPPATAEPVTPAAAVPRATPARRRLIVIAAASAVLVLAAAILVVFLNRTPPITAQGDRNAAAFGSESLRSFARTWLNDVTACESKGADGLAVELVNCTGDGWSVNFRRYSSAAEREQSRDIRRRYQVRSERDLTGSGPGSGVRIAYNQDNTYEVIYWDDDGSPVSGDLYTTELTPEAIAAIWDRYVR
jgi:actin-like ATPase involved in cell morphogenesis